MAELVDITRVVVGPKNLVATVVFAPQAPLMTSEDIDSTARVYWLMPDIATHACLGDAGETFEAAMGDTQIAHLIEHIAIELMVQTGMAADITCGKTRATADERTFEIELACPDDVLTTAALSSAVWIAEWAFGSADAASAPDVAAIVSGIQALAAASYDMPGNLAAAPTPEQEAAAEADALVGVEEAPEAATDAVPIADENNAAEQAEVAAVDDAAAAEVAAADDAPAATPAPEPVAVPEPEPEPKRGKLDFDARAMPRNRRL